MGISENIKLLREQYGLSQKELGQIAGVSDKAVSTWEQGIKEPSTWVEHARIGAGNAGL